MKRAFDAGRQECSWAAYGRRGGYTLFEMMAVYAMLAAFMATAIVLLGLLLRAETTGHEAAATQLTLARLSRQWRDDAHAARSATMMTEPAGAISLQSDADSSVVWSVNDGTVQRLSHRGDATTARDSFQIPEGKFDINVTENGAMIELRGRRPRLRLVSVPDAAPQLHSQEFVIQAAVGIRAAAAAPQNKATTESREQAR